MELGKTMENGFSNIFLQYLQNIFILWKKSSFFRKILDSLPQLRCVSTLQVQNESEFEPSVQYD